VPSAPEVKHHAKFSLFQMKMGYKNDHRTKVSRDYAWRDWCYIQINSRIYGSVTNENCFKETASVAHCSQCGTVKSIIGAAIHISGVHSYMMMTANLKIQHKLTYCTSLIFLLHVAESFLRS